jgi:predicted dehydrogenase
MNGMSLSMSITWPLRSGNASAALSKEAAMADRPVRFALIGAGAIGQTYAQAFDQSNVARLVAVVDIRDAAAAALAEAAQCRAFGSTSEMLESACPEAAVVCTPPVTHPDVAVELLNAGVPVLCEKPLATSVPEARRMLDAAEKADRLLTMASKFRCVGDVIQAKSFIESGTIGDVVLFENVFSSHVDMTSRWNSDPSVSGGGVLIDNGTHSVDILRYFLGPLAELQVVEGKRSQGLAVEETVRLNVRSADGALGSIDLSWSIDKEQPAYISIYGTQGTLQVGWKQSRYRRFGDKEWTDFGRGYSKVAAFLRQIENFALALQGKEDLLVSPEDALASVDAIEAAYRSMAASPWHAIGPKLHESSVADRPPRAARERIA